MVQNDRVFVVFSGWICKAGRVFEILNFRKREVKVRGAGDLKFEVRNLLCRIRPEEF